MPFQDKKRRRAVELEYLQWLAQSHKDLIAKARLTQPGKDEEVHRGRKRREDGVRERGSSRKRRGERELERKKGWCLHAHMGIRVTTLTCSSCDSHKRTGHVTKISQKRVDHGRSNNRMARAAVGLGFACRWLALIGGREARRGCVSRVPDRADEVDG